MNKKKIIITIDWFDPAYKAGGPVISIIKLIENMREFYDFWIVTGARDYGDKADLSGIETDKWLDWRGLAKVYYVSTENKTRKKIFEILDESRADIYYIQGIFSLYFSIYPLIWWHQAKEDRVIVATRGMFHKSALSIKRTKKLFYLYMAKFMGWFHHVIFHSTNPEETEQLHRILGHEATYMEASNFPRKIESGKNNHIKEKDSLNLLCVARISPEKNTLFLLDVLKITKGIIKLTLIGNYNNEAYFQQFKNKVAELPSNITVDYLGHKQISELQEFYDNNDVFILPTTGENYGHAIIEALSSGLPCIISKNTPWNQLNENNAGCNLDEDIYQYAHCIEKFYTMDVPEFSKASEAAKKYADLKVDLAAIKASYIKMLG